MIMRMIFFTGAQIVLFLLPLLTAAQKPGQSYILGIPQEFVVPEKNSDKSGIIGVRTGTCWEVFSDRDDNRLYTTSDAKIVASKPALGDRYYVVNITGDYLHVYTDPSPDTKNLTLSKAAADKGWIKAQNLVLWRHCLVDGTTKRTVQVMTYGHTDLLSSEQDGKNPNREGVDIFADPDLKIRLHRRTQAFQLYFVFKAGEKAYLIGREKRVPSGSNPKDIIEGWVPAEFCYIPETRLWIAPNKDPEAEGEMTAKKVLPTIFFDPEQAKNFMTSCLTEKKFIAWQYDGGKDPHAWNFFPLLSEKGGLARVKLVNDDFTTAFAPVKADGIQHSFFMFVTLITHEELMTIVRNMKSLLESASEKLDREKMQQSLVRAMRDEFPEMEENRILSYSLGEIMENLFWISNSKDPVLAKSLRKITDPEAIPDPFLLSMTEKIRTSLNGLSGFASMKNDESTFVSNDIKYHWVDLSLFY
jgi:hypothetical protein